MEQIYNKAVQEMQKGIVMRKKYVQELQCVNGNALIHVLMENRCGFFINDSGQSTIDGHNSLWTVRGLLRSL